MKRALFLAATLVGSLALPGAVASAGGGGGGGGGGGSFPTPITTAGSCNLDPTNMTNEIIETAERYAFDVDVALDGVPGGVRMHVVRLKASTTAYVESVCLEDGWSLLKYKPDGSWSSAGGFEITFAYQGQPAFRYRHVSGGIRFTYYL